MVSRERYRGFYDTEPGSFVLMQRQISDAPSHNFLAFQGGLFAGIHTEQRLQSLPGFNHATSTPAAVQNADAYMNIRWSKALKEAEDKEAMRQLIEDRKAENAALKRLAAMKHASDVYASETKGPGLKQAKTALKQESVEAAKVQDLGALRDVSEGKARVEASLQAALERQKKQAEAAAAAAAAAAQQQASSTAATAASTPASTPASSRASSGAVGQEWTNAVEGHGRRRRY
jgi:hypothetical protein